MPSGVNSNFCSHKVSTCFHSDGLGGVSDAYRVNLLVGTGSTEAVETELLVRVLLPAESGHDLDGHGGDAIGDDGELVVLGLGVEDLSAGHGDNTGLEVLLLEGLDGLETDADLGTSGDEGDIGLLVLKSDVTTLDGLLDGGALELGKVLAGKGQDGGSVLGGEGDVVSGGALVAVSRAPDHHVGQGTEVSKSLNRLVSGAVLTKTDGVVGGDVEDALLGERGETHGTGGVRDEVEESATGGDEGAVCGKTVHDGGHGVLAHTVAHVATAPLTDAGVGRLEVDGGLPAGVVGASKIGRAGDELGNDIVDLLEDGLGELTGGNRRVGSLVSGELLLPVLGELAGQTTLEVGSLGLVLGGVLLEELVPLLLSGGTLVGVLVVHVVDLLGNDEALGGVEAELLLDGGTVVLLEGVTVDATSALELGAEANGGGESDHGGLVLDGLALLDGLLNALKVVVTVLDPHDVPAVGLEALADVLSEGALGVTVCGMLAVSELSNFSSVLTNGNVVVVVEGDQVAELQVTGSGGSLGGNTLHGAAITEEAVGVVVDKLVAGLVEGTSGLALSHGETDGIGETLAERTSGDLNALGVVGLGVTGGDAVELTEVLEVVEGELVAEQVEQGVLQDTAVAVGEDEAVTVEPLGVLGVEPHELVEQHVGL